MPGTRKLGRPTDHRMSMLRGMVTYLLEKGQIETTLTRAKEVRSVAEKMITLGKKNNLSAYRQAMSFITKESVVHELFSVIAPKYEKMNGGYTQIYKIGPRRGDAAEMAIIKLVEVEKPAPAETKAKTKRTKKSANKKAEVQETSEAVQAEATENTEAEDKAAEAANTAEAPEVAEATENTEATEASE